MKRESQFRFDQRKRNRIGVKTPIMLHEKMNILLIMVFLILIMTSVIFGVFVRIAQLDNNPKPDVTSIEKQMFSAISDSITLKLIGEIK